MYIDGKQFRCSIFTFVQYRMDHPKFNVTNQKEESISIQKVKVLVLINKFFLFLSESIICMGFSFQEYESDNLKALSGLCH